MSGSRLAAVVVAVSTVCRFVLAGVFLAAGGLKVIDPQASVQAVRAYELVPEALEQPIGWGLPFFEIALGLLLASGLFTRIAAGVSAGLLGIFLGAVVAAAARGLSIDCGCFGGGGRLAPGQSRYAAEILRDIGLLALAGWLIWKPHSRFSLDHTDLEDGE